MAKTQSLMARQVAQAASAFQLKVTGREPQDVAVVLEGDTLVITMRGALAPAELALATDPVAAAKLQELRSQLFANSADALRLEIKRIIGVDVCESAAKSHTSSGVIEHTFTTGTMVHVFLLAQRVPEEKWSAAALS